MILVDHIIIDGGESELLYEYMIERNGLGNEVGVVEVKNIADDGDEPDIDIVEICRFVNECD